MSNDVQTVTDEFLYDAFGNVLARSGATPTPSLWGGAHAYQSDYESGLILMGNRYYDPATGRFISQDPAQDDRNWYAYCGNNPLVAVDPDGQTEVKVGGQAKSAFGVAAAAGIWLTFDTVTTETQIGYQGGLGGGFEIPSLGLVLSLSPSKPDGFEGGSQNYTEVFAGLSVSACGQSLGGSITHTTDLSNNKMAVNASLSMGLVSAKTGVQKPSVNVKDLSVQFSGGFHGTANHKSATKPLNLRNEFQKSLNTVRNAIVDLENGIRNGGFH